MENDSNQHLDLTIREIKDLKDKNNQMSLEMKELKDAKSQMALEVKELKDAKTQMSSEIEQWKKIKEQMSRKFDFLLSFHYYQTGWNYTSFTIRRFAATKQKVLNRGRSMEFSTDTFVCLDGYHASLEVELSIGCCGALSVIAYFILEKDPYDYNLEWPFQGAVEFSCEGINNVPKLIHKFSTTELSEQDIKDCFQRPCANYYNIGHGRTLINQNEINNYVVNNTMTIELNVMRL